MSKRWTQLFLAMCIWVLLTPILYISGMDSYLDGQVVQIHEYIVYGLCAVLGLYPFAKAIEFWSCNKRLQAIGSAVLGVALPVVSGVFWLFLELACKFWRIGGAKNT